MLAYTQIQVRSGTAAEWEVENPILKEAEPGYAVDTKKFKIGDGVTSWNDLPFYMNNIELKSLIAQSIDDMVTSITPEDIDALFNDKIKNISIDCGTF